MRNKLRKCGRGKRIRTSGPCLPKTVLYQAELFPDRCRNRFVGGPVRQECAYREGFPGWQAINDAFFAKFRAGRQRGS
jgi:hypothetical protein